MPAPRRSPVPLIVVLGLGAAALGGCSHDSAAPSTASTPPDSALVGGAYANPLDPIMFPDENQQAAIDASLRDAIGTCMSERGFTYVAGDGLSKHRTAADAQYTYSVTDPAVAAEYGFHPASWVAAIQQRSSDPGTRPDGYDTALFGRSDAATVKDDSGAVIAAYDPQSCLGQSRDRVTPGWAEQDRLYAIGTDILLDVADAVSKDDDVVQARTRWSLCMAEAGYDYDAPMDANNDPAFATDLPTATEIPVAVASATCQQSSGLLRSWSLARAQLTQHELDAHPGLVTRWLELNAAAGKGA